MARRVAWWLLAVVGCGGVPANEPQPHPVGTPTTPPFSTPAPQPADDAPVDVAMVRVPAGSFWRGCDAADATCPRDEQPRRRIGLQAYALDATQVTVAAYRRCVRAGACPDKLAGGWGRDGEHHPSARCNFAAPGREEHPMNCVSWNEAAEYCAWAQKRLPTGAEWEKAMRGADGPRAPWGDAEPSCAFAAAGAPLPEVYNVKGCPDGPTHPVGGGPSGPFGTRDLPGNVWEWVGDRYGEHSYAAATPEAPEGPLRESRGIRWYSAAHPNGAESEQGRIVISTRSGNAPGVRSYELGFRCAGTGVAPAAPPSSAAPPSAPAAQPAPDLAFATTLARLAGRCDAAPASVSPDGRRVALCWGWPGSVDLFFYDPDHDELVDRLHVASPLDLDRAEPWRATTPLHAYATAEDATHPGRGKLAVVPQEASGEGLTVRYRDPVLSVVGPGGKVLAKRTFPAWKAGAWASGCHAPGALVGVLAAVSGSRDHGVLVVTLASTSGVEGCGQRVFVARSPLAVPSTIRAPDRAPTTPR